MARYKVHDQTQTDRLVLRQKMETKRIKNVFEEGEDYR